MTTNDKLRAAHEHAQAGRLQQAEQMYREVLAAEPRNAYALRAMGQTAHSLGRSDVAAQWLELLVQVTPNDPAVYNNLATTYAILGDTDSALSAFDRALTHDPNQPGYHYNLATLLKEIGQVDQALDSYREAIRLDPASMNPHAWSNLLYLLHFHPAYDPQKIHREHVEWAAANADRLEFDIEPHRKDRSDGAGDAGDVGDAGRKLKIGYVSPLLRRHAISAFLLPLVENHDRERFDVTFYTDLTRGDDVTDRYRAVARHWREIAGMSHEQVANLVRADGIDILIDLNLHMASDRLEVFARKPAPVQVTYLGYPSTTGLKQIDWRITDAHLDPATEEDRFYFERSYRLPWSFCYRPIDATPEVNELPARSAGRVTFGCFNRAMKLNGLTVDLWAKVLRAVSRSRLILLAPAATLRRTIGERLAASGVPAERVEFVEHVPYADYMARYHQVDIALDTLPYPGYATTCDALWMGVPVVTLPGATAVSRGGASILNAAGLPELIADSDEDYVERVIGLTRDLEKLARLRASLRDRMQNSPLMDAPRFVRDSEHAMRSMWLEWTQSNASADK